MIYLYYHKKKRFTLPASFEELTPKKYIQLAPLLFSGGEELSLQVKVFRILSGMGTVRFLLLKSDTLRRCLPHIQWVFEKTLITKQLIPKYKGYYGPASDFDNLKMKEFHQTELFYRQLVIDGQDEAINRLVAVLYRRGKKGYDKKRNPDGDIREAFNEHEVEYHAKKIRRWPDAVKQAIFLWYDDCRQNLIENNPLVFSEPKKGFESQFDAGLYGMIRSLAGQKLGSVDRIEDLYVHHAMLELGMTIEEEKRIEEELNKKKTK